MFACLYAPSAAQENLLALASSFSPMVEDTARGVVVFSIVGLGRLIGTPREIAATIARRGAEMGIHANLAISADPDTAILAAQHIRGFTLIPPGEEAGRLGGLPVQVLPAEPECLETPERWGIHTFAELAALPAIGFIARFGEAGERLLRLARGETHRALRAVTPRENYRRVIALDYPQRLLEPLLLTIAQPLEEWMQRISTNSVTLGLLLANRSEHRRTLEFPVPVRDPKIVLKQLQFDLEAHPPRAAVIGVEVQLNPAEPRVQQHGLFIPQAPVPEKLHFTLARLGALMGQGNVGSPELLDTHRPDAFRMRAFSSESAGSLPPAGAKPRFAFRYYRPAIAVVVRVREQQPVLVNARQVVVASGPWRASGDWWTHSPWDREEWDVELNNGGLYRVYSASTQWFLEGVYD